MKNQGTQEKLIGMAINGAFFIDDISYRAEKAILSYDYWGMDIDPLFLLRKGRVFKSKRDAIERHEEIRSLLLPFNDDRIFDKDSGKLLIDINDETIRAQYNIVMYGDVPEFWTISLSHDVDSKSGFSIKRMDYGCDEGFTICDIVGFDCCHFVDVNVYPAILFATKEEAEAALEKVEPLLHEEPQHMFSWVDDFYFWVNMKKGYFSRESSRRLPSLIWNTYCPFIYAGDSRSYSGMETILRSGEGLYKKSNTEYDYERGFELVMRTDGSEWHFRDNKVSINNTWLPVSVLFPIIGISTQADLFETFGVETEKVVLNKDNYKDYVDRTLAFPVEKVFFTEVFVDEDTNETITVKSKEVLLEQNTQLPEEFDWIRGDIDSSTIEVIILKNKDDKLADYLLNIPLCDYNIVRESLYGGGDIHNQWEAAANAFQYMQPHTRLTHIGRMRLDKALHIEKQESEETFETKERIDYAFCPSKCVSENYVTSRDFIEIIKLLAYKGKGYNPMTDRPVYSPDERLDDSILKEIINRRKEDFFIKWQEETTLIKECFEIDYALHCDEPLV